MDDEVKIQPTSKLSKALAAAQAKFPKFENNSYGYSYSYLNLAGVLETVLPILGSEGISLVQKPSVRIEGDLPWCVVETVLMCEDEAITNVLDFPMMTARKGLTEEIMLFGSTVSYLRRYAVMSILGIAGADKTPEDMQAEAIKKTEEE